MEEKKRKGVIKLKAYTDQTRAKVKPLGKP